jgi:polyisoprenoid-binding protein YceI
MIVIVAVLALVVVGCAATETAEQPTAASNTEAATPTPEPTEPVEEAAVEEPTATEAEDAESTEAESTEATATPAEVVEAEAETASAGPTTFNIVPESSEARFTIDEVLMGNDKTVVGTTSDVTGEIMVDPANPAAAQIGAITINARDLTTDDSRRTGQLQRNILKSGQDAYQYITFTPTSVDGLPDTVTVGEPFTFQVTGDLTILDTTKPVTFDMTVTPTSETELTGSGTARVLYADYGISIPSVPFVADVSDEVGLEIDFTAVGG